MVINKKSLAKLIAPISILLALLLLNINHAQADYRADAAAIKNHANLETNLNEAAAKRYVPNYQGVDAASNPPQASYYQNPTAMDESSHLAAQNSDAGKIARSAFDNKGDYDLSYLPKDDADAIKNIDIANIIKLFTGAYSDCQPTNKNNLGLLTTKTCDQYYQAIENSCQIPRKIEVVSNFTYACSKDLNYTTKNCSKDLTIVCDNQGECDAGGINLSSINSDMAWRYNYPIITIGSIGDNYWSQRGGTYNGCDYRRSTSFEIKNVNEITVFNLRSLAYDDQMSIAINGHQIFSGPTNNIGNCIEYARTWTANPNLDLIPYLKNGINTIDMRVLVGGKGEAWINIEARQNCCNNPREVWQEVCS